MNPPAGTLIAETLAIRRGERTLFESVGFVAPPGSVLLLRGPNGSGKSSLLLAIAGLLRPQSGSIRLEGADEGYLDQLHFVGHQPGVKSRLTLRENLDFWRDMLGRPHRSADDALAAVGLGGLGALEAGYLSAGQTRRLALARLLVARRPVWLLDEPTSALDAEGEAMVGGLMAAHVAEGGIVLAATHLDLPLDGLRIETLRLGGHS